MRALSRLILLLSILISTSVAFAEPKKKPIRDELPPAAVAAWDDGRLLLDLTKPDFQKALIKFREAYNLSKNPRVLFNVAYCERNLEKYARAMASLKQELAEGGNKLPADEVQQINSAIAALARYVTTLEIQVNEPGAAVVIDGESVGSSPIPAPLAIDIGPHVLRVSKPSFLEVTKNITISGPSKESIILEPLQRKSRVEIAVSGAPKATIKIDGVDMGPAPFVGDLPIGRHTFAAEAQGYVTATQTSEVKYKEPLNLTLALAQRRQEGRLKIQAEPAGAIIEIDGQVKGSSVWEGILPSGSHQVTVRKDGYQPVTNEMMVGEDATLERRITLSQATGSRWLVWTLGGIAVVGGGVLAAVLIAKSEEQQVPGTLRRDENRPVSASFRF